MRPPEMLDIGTALVLLCRTWRAQNIKIPCVLPSIPISARELNEAPGAESQKP